MAHQVEIWSCRSRAGAYCRRAMTEGIHETLANVPPWWGARQQARPPRLAEVLDHIAETCPGVAVQLCDAVQRLPCRHEPGTPRFDGKNLWVGETLVRCYRHSAKNQFAVLRAFQACGWQTRIDDPMTAPGDLDPVRRLNDTIYELNWYKGQRLRLIRFRCDGTGRGICWEFVK